MQKTDLTLIESQIAIFQNGFDFEVTALYRKLLSELPEYDIKPELLPFQDLPKNIVRLFIYNKYRNFEIRISPEKISYYWYSKQPNESISINELALRNILDLTYTKIVDPISINRIGVINTYALDKNKFSDVKNKLVPDKFKSELLSSFSTQLTFNVEHKGKIHNHLLTVDTNAIFNETKERIISVQSDLNSQQDTNLDFEYAKAVEHIMELFKKNSAGGTYKLLFE